MSKGRTRAGTSRTVPTPRRRGQKRYWLLLAFIILTAVTVAASFMREPRYKSPYDGTLTRDAAHGIQIASRDDALTFARYYENGSLRLIRVDAYRNGVVEGVRLDALLEGDHRADPITLLGRVDYAGIAAATGPRVRLADTKLDTPFDGTANQIAIGGNYPLHMKETSLTDSFVFPKRVQASRFDAGVSAGDGLLDYEIELGFVPIATPDFGPKMGLVLATDYTDREVLMKRIKLSDVPSGQGFTDAKSQPGYMPIGNLFVVPRNVDHFYRQLNLELFVNRQRRQVAPPEQMTWDMREIMRRSLAAADSEWSWQGGTTRLPIEHGRIADRTIILSGANDGIIFQSPSIRQRALGGVEALLTPWRAREALVGATIREAKREQRYLQPLDSVVGRADMLGLVRNRITP